MICSTHARCVQVTRSRGCAKSLAKEHILKQEGTFLVPIQAVFGNEELEYVYDDVTYVYDDVTYLPIQAVLRLPAAALGGARCARSC